MVKTEEEAKKITEDKKAALRDNPVVFILTESLVRHISFSSEEERQALSEKLTNLAKYHPYLGGLVFETEQTLKTDYGLNDHDIAAINRFMQAHNLAYVENEATFKIGALPIYNHRAALPLVMATQSPEHGTARRDNYRDELNKILGTKTNDEEGLKPDALISLDEKGNLTAQFNLSTQLKDKILEAGLTNEEIELTIHNALKRVVRRAFMQKHSIDKKTDDPQAINLYDSEYPTLIQMNGGKFDVTIPLNNKVRGSFLDKDFDRNELAQITDNVSKEALHAIEVAIALKRAPAPF